MSKSSRSPRFRPNAPFFEASSLFGRKKKAVKEYCVVQSYNESMAAARGRPFADIISNECDPPDFFVEHVDGKKSGIELTELVCRKATELNVTAMRESRPLDLVYREWSMSDVVVAIQNIIQQKDNACANVFEKFPELTELTLLIHTDEPDLDFFEIRDFLEGHSFQRPRNLGKAMLLFSYDPRVNRCPYVTLSCLARN